uniref:Uncharacterized protein n=1 Tax=Hanusia phi TaxID=3032 RepID=A0A7S0ET13_9CRYP|mmetsp:Transcript_30627/g.69130  ORF Transcript_30627/g.69130 Transcript_30627/m.69130 type:complete len:198 (+) Transcript_30627:59-652(+)|eukprot:748433-Hanusia_phi.AAC.2
MASCFSCFPSLYRLSPSETNTRSPKPDPCLLDAQSDFLSTPQTDKARKAGSRSSFSFGTSTSASKKALKRQSLHADLSSRRSLWDEIGLGVGNIDYKSCSSLPMDSNLCEAGDNNWLNEDWAQRIIEATSSSGTASGQTSLTSSRSSDRDALLESPSLQSRGLYEDLVLTAVSGDSLVQCEYERTDLQVQRNGRMIV